MTPEARKEYDVMAAKLTSMYGAKWDKDAKTRRMVVQAAKVSAWNLAKIKKIADAYSVKESIVWETCMKLSTHLGCPLSNSLTTCETTLKNGTTWDDFVNYVNITIGGVRRYGE